MTEQALLDLGYRKYEGTLIDIFFKLETCTHSTNCVRNLPSVFNTKRKPWIITDNADKQETMRVMDNCPSGALKYIEKEQGNNLNIISGNNRFYINDNDSNMLAEVTYTLAGASIIIIDHTFVDPKLRGQKIGAKLISEVVKLAINSNKKIIPLCPFAKKEFESNESYKLVWHNK